MIKNYTTVLIAIILRCKNWLQVLFAKIFNKDIKEIKLYNGLKISINSKIGKADLSMFSEIFYKQYYNPKGFEINNGDIVFDVGANSGFFTYFVAQKNTNGKIYTFEPLPFLIDKIKKTITLNDFSNIKVENIAIGKDNTDPIPFYISKDHNGCHSLYERKGKIEKITVNIISLKKYCEVNNINRIDFLKLDCEGAEYDIITDDNMEFIKNIVNKMSIEYHDNINEHRHEEVVDLLSKSGFKVEVKDGYIYAINKNINKI